MIDHFWNGKKVLITGHTGFKGAWLSLLLQKKGARVFGYSLPSDESNFLYNILASQSHFHYEYFADIRASEKISQALEEVQPDCIFHLAAQSLVFDSLISPEKTFSVNIVGLISLFEAMRRINSECIILNVTSDKVYRNNNQEHAFSEADPLGGVDPYSASKACAEIVSEAYRKSILKTEFVQVSTARSGNVIGGGDMSEKRLVPDLIRAIQKQEPLMLRNPNSTRPWLHVLDALTGYLTLVEKMTRKPYLFEGAWNFGPSENSVTVRRLAESLNRYLEGKGITVDSENQFQEAKTLAVDSSKARSLLKWRNKLSSDDAVNFTGEWFRRHSLGEDMFQFSCRQIDQYDSL